MTAFVSAVLGGNRIEILSDGAAYDENGVVTRFRRKVTPIPGFMAATMTRGDVELGDGLQRLVNNIVIGEGSFDRGIGMLHRVLQDRPEWDEPVQCAIWGLSETQGPVAYWFATKTVAKGDGAWKLMSTAGDFCQGEAVEWPGYYTASGTLADKAVWIMQGLRKEAGADLMTGEPKADDYPIIGGHIDLTTITAKGVVQRRLHKWPDKIGERMVRDPSTIDPRSKAAYDRGLAIVAEAYRGATNNPAQPARIGKLVAA